MEEKDLQAMQNTTGTSDDKLDKQDQIELLKMSAQLTKEDVENTVEAVTQALSLKYGCGFAVEKIGDRYESKTVTFYLHPDFDEQLTFRAVYDRATEAVTDNLISRLMSKKITPDLTGALEEYDIKSCAAAVFFKSDDSGEDDTELLLEDYLNDYKAEAVMFYLAVSSAALDESFCDVMKKACVGLREKYGIDVVVCGFIIGNGYKDCAEKLAAEPKPTDAWFHQFYPTHTIRAVASADTALAETAEFTVPKAGE